MEKGILLKNMEKLKPKVLQKGDNIAIISPSGYVSYQEKFENAKKYFESKGYEVTVFPNAKNANNKHKYLAGEDSERLEDLQKAFEDKSIKAILTARGGYGALRLLDKIDYKMIQKNPKIFCGYSDITAYHCAIHKKTGLVTFHAPFALADFGSEQIDKFTEENFFNILTQNNINKPLHNAFEYLCIQKGTVQGELIGGNLCTINSLLGTGFEPNFENKILFIEDVNEPAYKIDRMLAQLKLCGVFKKIKGLLVGKFSNEEENYQEKIIDILKELQIPCGYGFSATHELQKNTLPLNVKYEINFANGEILVKENYIEA